VATNYLLTLLLQAMLALPIALPFVFAVLFCGVYIVLVLTNVVGALVSGYRRKPPQLWLSRRAMVAIALVVATLICIWSLFLMDGRFT
jgi:Mn2+/Fe2+ NRAMP family transporter